MSRCCAVEDDGGGGADGQCSAESASRSSALCAIEGLQLSLLGRMYSFIISVPCSTAFSLAHKLDSQ